MPPRLLKTVVLAVAVFATNTNIAVADELRVADPDVGAPADADIRSVSVTHDTGESPDQGRVVVKARVGTLDYGDSFDLWLDVPGDRAGAAYFARIIPESGYGAVVVTRGWGTRGRAACDAWDARAVTGASKTVTFSIPRSCLGEPTKVRAAVRATYVRDDTRVRDWVASERQYTAWVKASPAN